MSLNVVRDAIVITVQIQLIRDAIIVAVGKARRRNHKLRVIKCDTTNLVGLPVAARESLSLVIVQVDAERIGRVFLQLVIQFRSAAEVVTAVVAVNEEVFE